MSESRTPQTSSPNSRPKLCLWQMFFSCLQILLYITPFTFKNFPTSSTFSQNKIPSKINWFLSSPQVPYGKPWGNYMERSSRICKTSFWSTYHIFTYIYIYTHIYIYDIYMWCVSACVWIHIHTQWCASLGIAVASCSLLAMHGD